MVSTCGNYGTASQLLFLQNWQATPTCFGYLWYLGLDMQLHFCAPFLLHMLYRNTKRAILLAFTLVGLSVILRAGHCIFYNVCDQSDVDIPFISYPGQDVAQSAHIYAGIWELYARPYTKCGPFILGMLVGFSMSKVKLQISSALSNAILAVSLFLAIACIYAILPEYWYPHLGNTLYTVAYTATFRTFFAAVFCIAVLVLFYRSDRIRVRPIFPVLARLTFNAYLLHMPMVFVMNHLPFLQSAQSPYELVAVVPIVAILSFLASFVFYLTVESPLGRVSKSILNAAYKSN
ncbi:hypothetical protein AB6A40_005629 [Gnathostoma spinigerum]|uniref:Acyltransferase 3 domain-containing protein n=1 Tax=Gnathostoma spinigerum TaxID=75299 RepID=A0ABD6EFZ4_9BILA